MKTVKSEIINENPSTIEEAEADEFSTRHVGSVALAHGVHDLYAGFLPPFLPILIEKYGFSNLIGGSLTLFYSMPSLLQPLFGSLADQHNLRVFVSLAPLITGLMMTLLGVVPSSIILIGLLIVAGTSSAALHAIGPALNSKHAGKKLGRGMSFWVNAGSFGYALGSLIFVSAYDLLGLERLPLMAVLGAVVSVLVWNWLKDADTRAQGARTEKAKPRDWSKIIRVMAPVAFIIATRALMISILSTYFPAFLLELGANTFLSGAGLTLIFIAGVVGSFVAGSLSDRFSRLGILAIATIAQTACMLIFLQTKGWLQILVLILIGFFEVAAVPVFMAHVQEGFREERAFINGLFLSLNFVGSALAVPLVGRLADMYSYKMAFLVSSWMLPLGLLGLVWMRFVSDKKTGV